MHELKYIFVIIMNYYLWKYRILDSVNIFYDNLISSPYFCKYLGAWLHFSFGNKCIKYTTTCYFFMPGLSLIFYKNFYNAAILKFGGKKQKQN